MRTVICDRCHKEVKESLTRTITSPSQQRQMGIDDGRIGWAFICKINCVQKQTKGGS